MPKVYRTKFHRNTALRKLEACRPKWKSHHKAEDLWQTGATFRKVEVRLRLRGRPCRDDSNTALSLVAYL